MHKLELADIRSEKTPEQRNVQGEETTEAKEGSYSKISRINTSSEYTQVT